MGYIGVKSPTDPNHWSYLPGTSKKVCWNNLKNPMSISFPPQKKSTKKLQELLIQDVSQGRSRWKCVHDPCSNKNWTDRTDHNWTLRRFLHKTYKVGSNHREKLEWNHPHLSPTKNFWGGFWGLNISKNKIFGSILGGSSQLESS